MTRLNSYVRYDVIIIDGIFRNLLCHTRHVADESFLRVYSTGTNKIDGNITAFLAMQELWIFAMLQTFELCKCNYNATYSKTHWIVHDLWTVGASITQLSTSCFSLHSMLSMCRSTMHTSSMHVKYTISTGSFVNMPNPMFMYPILYLINHFQYPQHGIVHNTLNIHPGNM